MRRTTAWKLGLTEQGCSASCCVLMLAKCNSHNIIWPQIYLVTLPNQLSNITYTLVNNATVPVIPGSRVTLTNTKQAVPLYTVYFCWTSIIAQMQKYPIKMFSAKWISVDFGLQLRWLKFYTAVQISLCLLACLPLTLWKIFIYRTIWRATVDNDMTSLTS